ncbi:MAG: class I mannose-6-phosphate isomerase [Bacilli bacterium]|nr:class I mannose-6-phosphate isomerase [Bacilli bacterium]
MDTVKLKGITKDYIWGGKKLFDYGKSSSQDIIAESWELSFFDDNESMIDSGKYKGKTLKEVISDKELGKNVKKFPFFPVLIKLIDANKDLSIQVHPSDEYALKYENSFGKTEMWYVVEADENSYLHIGFNKDVSKEEVERRIKDNSLLEIMNHIKVKEGDCYFIPSGTLHAIGKGVLVCEIQENSNLTYRVYDYGRLDKNGNPRELHVEKALKVLNFNKLIPQNIQSSVLADCEYFKVCKYENATIIEADENSFVSFTIVEGSGFVNDLPYSKGDTFFVPANGKAVIKGKNKIITTKIN